MRDQEYFLSCAIFLGLMIQPITSILYPYESETREVKALDGLWKFCTTPANKPPDEGFSDQWYAPNDKMDNQHCQLMPVPASYNDIPTDSSIRDYVGWAWYRKIHFVPSRWSNDDLKIFVRFGSVHYHAVVWMNGQQIGEHVGGHLPFQLEVTSALKYGSSNSLTVAVNNTLTNITLPQMQIHHPNDTSRYPPGYITYSQKFDFFNYAGIHRPVYLLALPAVHISDINLITEVEYEKNGESNTTIGNIQFLVAHTYQGSADDVMCDVSITTQGGGEVHRSITTCSSTITIRGAKLWWPRFAHARPGYLYTFEVSLLIQGRTMDVYRLPFGIRSVSWDSSVLKINHKPVYLRGFGMHEDSNLRGKGLDLVHTIRDFELIKWLGANALRTSHYPYSEEIMNMADEFGVLVIAETPACTIDSFGNEILSHHKAVLNELISRDKNHPSVIAWSIANEPYSDLPQSSSYFKTLAKLIRSRDTTRAVTFVTSRHWDNDKAVQHMDIICVNRYAAWYSDSGLLSLIERQTNEELKSWHDKWKRPIIMSEYGAGSLSGFHLLPAAMWTEDYQIMTFLKHFPAFDNLRSKGLIAGEMIWNFADFATPQEYIRPGGCMKGLMTRDRQPKAAAHLARWRYWKLAQNISGYDLPHDLLYS